MKKHNYLKVLISLLGIFALFSCEIGLGESVDTEAPRFEISSPASGAIVRNKFRVGGSWSDDGTIKDVSVAIKRQGATDKEKIYYSGTAIEKGEGVAENFWYCDLDPLGTDKGSLIDGKYDVEVTFNDNGGHTSTQRSSFTIDNTPPVIVLQRPSSRSSATEDIDSYGRKFTLEGQAADDSNINLIEVIIYSDEECNNEVHRVKLNNVPNSINLDVAEFKEDIENDYSKIYGSTSVDDGEKPFYCKIVAYDEAQEYPIEGEQTEAQTLGNKTETYYLYEEIATKILANYKITDVYHMLNGSYKISNTNRSANEVDSNIKNVEEILKENVVEKGRFSLNPANNPTFMLVGRDPVDENGTNIKNEKVKNSVTNKSDITVEVGVGLDSIPIVKDSLRLYLLPYDTEGNKLSDEKIYPNDQSISKSGTSYKITTSINKDNNVNAENQTVHLNYQKIYIVGIDGKDEHNNEIVGKAIKDKETNKIRNTYGFIFASSGIAPEVILSAPTATYINKGEAIPVAATISTEEEALTVSVKLNDVVIVSEEKPVVNSVIDYTYTISAEDVEKNLIKENGVYKSTRLNLVVEVVGEDKAARATKVITCDIDKPEVEIDSLPSNTETQGSNFTFRGTASDATSGVSSVEFTITNEDGTKSKTVTAAGKENWYVTVAYQSEEWADIFATEDIKTVTIKVTDKVNNSNTSFTCGSETETITSKSFKYDRKNPVLKVTESTVKSFIPAEGFTITGTATDTKALKSLKVKEYFTPVNGVEAETPASKNDAYNTITVAANGTWNCEVPLNKSNVTVEDGTYSYEFILTDWADNIVSSAKLDSIVDTIPPTGSVNNPAAYTKATSITFTGSAKDENLDIARAYLQKKNSSGEWEDDLNERTELSPSKETGDWSWKVYDLSDGEYRVRLLVTDKAGNSVGDITKSQPELTSSSSIIVDTIAPTTSITATGLIKKDGSPLPSTDGIAAHSTITYYAKESVAPATAPFTVKGEVDEINFDKITLSAKKNNSDVTAPELTVSNKKWEFAPIMAANGTADGAYKYTLTVTDKAGNRNDYTVNVTYDTQKPIVSITKPANGSTVNQANIVANGNISDEGIGLKKLEYTTAADDNHWIEWKDEAENPIPENATTWEKSWTAEDQGDITLRVRATDILGHESDVVSSSFAYDNQIPQLSFAPFGATYIKEGKLVVTGTAYDTNLLSSIVIKEGNNTYTTDAEHTDITVSGQLSDAKSDDTKITWKKEIPVSSLADGLHTITVILKDKANQTNELSREITVDKTEPTVTIDATPTNDDTLGTSYTFTGTASDDTSGVNKVYFKLKDGKASDASATISEEIKASGTSSWFKTISFSDYFRTPGEKSIYVYAEDKAGNVKELAANEFKYDTQKPTVGIYNYYFAKDGGSGYNASGETEGTVALTEFASSKVFKITGKVDDDWGFDATTPIVVKQKKGDVIITLTGVTFDRSAKTWTVENLPRKADNSQAELATGTYTYEVEVKDIAGRTTKITVPVTVDVTPPQVSITTPNKPSLSATPDEALSGSAFNFIGTATDAGDGNVGIASYSYAFTYGSSTVPAANSTQWTTVDSIGGSWTISKGLEEKTTNNYSTNGKLCEGQWWLHVKATDKAGNVSNASSCSFYVDLKAPAFTVNTKIVEKIVEASDKCIKEGTNYFFKGDLTIAVEAEDTYGLAAAPYSLSIGSTSVTGVTPTKSGDKYIYVIPADKFSNEGEYQTLTVTATDKVGRIVTKDYSVYRDEKAPEVEITKPEAGSQQDTASINAVFSIEEDGVGIKKQTMKADGKTPEDTPDSELYYSTDGSNWIKTKYTGGARYTQPLTLGDPQGPKKLYVKAKDKLGNESSTPKLVEFYYDYEVPVLTSTSPNAYAVEDSTITLTGTAYDTYELDYIEVKDTTANIIYKSNGDNPAIKIQRKTSENPETWSDVLIKTAKAESPITWKLSLTAAQVNALAEGKHNFKIKAYDKSGQISDEITETVFIDRTKPEVIDNSSLKVPTVAASSYKFEVPVKDGTNSTTDSRVKEVKLQFTDGINETEWLSASEGSTTWDYTMVFSDYADAGKPFATEGSRTVNIKAIDAAGNESDVVTKTFMYDKANPTVGISSYTPNGSSAITLAADVTDLQAKSEFQLAGTAADTNRVKRVEVYEKVYENEKLIAVQVGNATTWTVQNLPRNAETSLADKTKTAGLTGTAKVDTGTYTYKVVVYDDANKSTEKTLTVKIDKTAPTVSITTPSNDTENCGEQAVSSTSFQFAGTASDDSESSATGIGAIWYKVVNRGDEAPTAPTTNTTVDSGWTGFTKATGTTSWNFYEAFKAKGAAGTSIEEGNYTLYVFSVDKAGNVCTTPAKVNFDVDMKAPLIETKWGDGTDYSSSVTQIKTATGYGVKYKVTETHGYATGYPKFSMKKDDIEFTSFTESVADANGYKTVTINSQTDGLYEYTIEAIDIVGKKTTVTRNVRLDTKPPVLQILSPDLNAFQPGTSITVKGSAEDDSGTLAVWYSYGAASQPEIPALADRKTDSEWTGWTKATGTTSWTIGNLSGAEGVIKNLYIVAVDNNGLVSPVASNSVKVDTTAPTSTTSESALITNNTFSLTGDVYDTNGIASVTIRQTGSAEVTYSTDANVEATPSIIVTGKALTQATSSTNKATWSKEFTITKASRTGGAKTGELSDGVYTFEITTTDVAGKTRVRTKEVTIDTQNPVISKSEVNSSNNANKEGWFKDAQLPLDIKAYDTANRTDIETIEYKIDGGIYLPLSITDDKATNSTGKKSTSSISIPDGKHTITIKATDKAGNSTEKILECTKATAGGTEKVAYIWIDTKAPNICTTTLSGSVLSQGTEPFVFDVTVGDAAVTGIDSSDIASVSLSMIKDVNMAGKGITVTNIAAGVYRITIPANTDGKTDKQFDGQVYVTVTDKAGNSQEFPLFTLEVDTQNPEISFTSLANGGTVNGTIDISGIASDNKVLESVKVEYLSAADTWTELPKVGITTPGTTNWSYPSIKTDPASSDSNKITLFDSNSTKAGQQLKLRATAKDKSGRTKKEVIEVTIDQDTDRPLIKFTNLTNMGTDAAPVYYLKYGTDAQMEGNITDDDANSTSVISEFIVSTSAVTSKEGWIEGGSGDTVTYTKGTEVTSYNKKTGDFTFTPGNTDDGSKAVYFYIKDNAGTVFYTANDGTYNETYKATGKTVKQLYYQNKAETATKASSAAAVSYKSDSTAPAITNIQIQPYTGTTENGAPVLALGATVGGTKKNQIELIVKTQDANGILGTTVEVTQGTTTKTYRSNDKVGTGSTWTDTGSESATNTASEVIWILPKIDLDEKASDGTTPLFNNGEVSVKVTTYDQAGIYANQTIKFNVDKVAPGVSFSNQTKAEGATIYGIDEQTIAVTLNATDVANIKYAVTNSSTIPADNAKYSDGTTSVWNEVTTSGLSANIIFDGNTSSTTGGTHSNTLRSWMLKVFNETETELAADDVNKIMYIHIRAEDECGNITNVRRYYTVIPNGNKPTVTIAYPETNGSALAGTIRINGSSNVSVGTVSKILVQVDTAFDSAQGFNAFWKNGFDTINNSLTKKYTLETITSSTGTAITGIVASGTDMWNLAINGNKEFNPERGSRNMAIRVYAVCESRNGDTTVTKFSDPEVKYFSLDPNAPEIGGDDTGTGTAKKRSLQLIKFKSGHEKDFAHIEATKKYTSEMWVSGSGWYLVAAVHDNSGIKELTLDRTPNVTNSQNKTSIISYTGSGESIVVTPDTNYVTENTIASNTTAKNYYMFIPLTELGTANSCGNINWQLEAVENTNDSNSCKLNININYDNIAPKLGLQTHTQHDINPEVKQSNGFYILKSYVTDATDSGVTSGLQSVAFYFARRGKSDKSKISIIDPMTDTSNSQLVATGETMTEGYSYGEGLYWRHKTGVTVSGAKVTLAAADSNIYVGGLAKLGGVIYRIESKNAGNTEFTLDSNPPSDITVADFAMALVVEQGRNDNTSDRGNNGNKITESGYGKGYYPYDRSIHGTKDDGDLMEEAWDGSSVAAQWQAKINSKNIPDGPIEIHYVVFDKSQNYSTGIVSNVAKATYLAYTTPEAAANKTLSEIAGNEDTTNKLANRFAFCFGTTTESTKAAYVSNNAPRIVSVTVGCDYNGNKTIADDEKTTKYVGEGNRYLVAGTPVKKATSYTDTFIASTDGTGTGSAWKTINDTTKIEVELIGGNGDVKYQYAINSKFRGGDGEGNTAFKGMTDLSRTVTAITNSGTTYEDVSGRTTYKDTTNQEYYLGEKTGYLMISNETSGITPSADLKFTDFANWSSFTNSTTTAPTWITMKFWDNTAETTPFTDSQYATLELPLAMELKDTTKPNTVINDLYWNSATDNSVYKDVNGKLYGHVELHGDYDQTDTTSDMATEYGVDDDKVSGVVKFSGYAYDNKRLSALNFGITTTKGSIGKNASGESRKNNTNQCWPQTLGTPYVTFDGTNWTTAGLSDADISANKIGTTNPWSQFKVYTDAEHGAYIGAEGHKVYWELIIDTSHVQEAGKTSDTPLGVGRDLYVWVEALDSSDNATNMTATDVTTGTDATKIRPNYKIDVVPYITGVTTRLSNGNTADPTSYSRTAKGHYPIDATEGNITLSGYNLTVGNGTVEVASTEIASSRAYAYTKVAASESTPAIVSINNMNNNEAHGDYNIDTQGLTELNKVKNMYNRVEAYNSNTNLKLTDDIYFDVWNLNNRAAEADGALQYPVMHINPKNNQIGFGFAKGGDSISFPTNDYSYRWFQKNNKNYIGTNFVYDSNGYAHTISIGMDSQNGSGVAGRMLYINSHWWANNDGRQKGVRHWDQRFNVALESVMIPNGVYVKGVETKVANDVADNVSADRYPSTPAIAVANHSNVPTVYIMYYDYVHDQLRFRYGTVNTTTENRYTVKNGKSDNSNTVEDYNFTQFGLLNDSKSERQRHAANWNNDPPEVDDKTIDIDTNANGDNYSNHSAFEASKSYYALVAGDYYKQKNDGLEGTVGSRISETGNKASQYYALDVVPGTNVAGDKVVIVWYADHKLYMTYRTNLGTADNTDARAAGRANGNTIQWKPTATLLDDPSKSLKDIAMKVDSDGGIHIIAGDSTNADLNYLYLPNADWMYASRGNALHTTHKPYTCVVDSYSIVGDTASIDTVKNSAGKIVPYISYYAPGFGSKPKVAFLINGIDSTADNYGVTAGADSDSRFTGAWEVSLIPTNAELRPDNNKMNIGLWRDRDGKIKSDNTGSDDKTNTYERKRYCNGSSGVVLGYGIREGTKGYIETAMYKGMPSYE